MPWFILISKTTRYSGNHASSQRAEKQALPYADITNPQTLNKYQYAYNNPLRYVDPDGHDPDGQDNADHTVSNLLLGISAGSAVVAATGAAASAGVIDIPVTGPITVGAGLVSLVSGGLGMAARYVESFGTAPKPLTGAPAPLPQTATPPQGQTQPLPPPPPIQAKNDRKVNQKRYEEAKKAYEETKAALDKLKSTPNKTKEIKEEIERLERKLNKELDRMKKSEPHDKSSQRH